ncbi:MAG TPA: CHAT domain-containing protein, partial [Casimicrobiaceae bacterium]|nr:CHAT domain-containing protein [Casimicrobiaceae bacterium]
GGFLCLEREELSDGTFEAEKLGLALSGKGVRLAVLAACVTAQVELELPWSSVARALVAGGVPAVVGMQLNIDDRSALEFLSTFYHALATCLPIGTAINEARKRIGLLRELDRDFGVPVLYLRNAQGWDGVIFPPPRPEPPVERGIRAADAYKRLHDALHKAKMDAFHLIMGYANDFPPKSGASQRPLRSYVNTIKRCVSEMRGIVAEGHCDRDLIDPFVDALDQATVQLESAVTHLDRDTFIDALPQLNSVFSRDMSMLDVSLHNTTKELPLHDALRAATPREFAELQEFIEAMKLRVVTHHACQRLEDLLDDLRDPRNADTVSASALRRRQKDIRALLESCIGALDKKRGDSLTALAQALDEALAASDPERLATAYDDFRAAVGMAFYEIDSELKEMCSRLCKDPRLVNLAAMS